MNIITSVASLNSFLDPLRSSSEIGFIPTMGALHQGHLSLVKQSLKECGVTVVSVFVNPTQFNNATDLAKYPRTLQADAALLKKASKDIVIFAPQAADLYNGSVTSRHFNFGPLANEMEGKHRPGHFDGVGTVVSLLLRAVRPQKAYFGQKDFQQLQIIQKLVEIESIPTKIVGCPIVREQNGVALSSRNKRLSAIQFEQARVISRTLREIKENFSSTSITKLNTIAKQRFQENPHIQLEYFEIANSATLKTVQRKRKGNKYRAFVAAFAGEVRLIDNMELN